MRHCYTCNDGTRTAGGPISQLSESSYPSSFRQVRTPFPVSLDHTSSSFFLVICSADAALGDCAMLKLIQLIQDHSTNLAAISLSLQNVIAAACSTLGARPEALKELLVAQNNPLSFGQLVQRDAVVARGKIHRALCATRYIRLLETLVSYVDSLFSVYHDPANRTHYTGLVLSILRSCPISFSSRF